MIAALDGFRERAAAHLQATSRPLVTLSYAQSLDGCLTIRAGQPSPISGPQSRVVTHRLRAAHDAILVGIGTVLADDPNLTVRLVEGDDPQPVIVDSRLRFPLEARLLSAGCQPWIATAEPADPARRAVLEGRGARVLTLPPREGRVSLPALLDELGQMGITSLMVEGGAQVITSFLRERLADQLILTVAPVLVGGLHAVGDLGVRAWKELPRLCDAGYEQAGRDLIVWGTLVWEEGA